MIGDHDPAPKPSLEERRRASRIRWTAGVGVALAACLAAALAIAMTRGTTREQEGTPRLRLRPCTLGVETPARCGRLLVPENRSDPAGRKISLRVAVIPSPVQPGRGCALLPGGRPGWRGDRGGACWNDLFGKVNAQRDLVLRRPARHRRLASRSSARRSTSACTARPLPCRVHEALLRAPRRRPALLHDAPWPPTISRTSGARSATAASTCSAPRTGPPSPRST